MLNNIANVNSNFHFFKFIKKFDAFNLNHCSFKISLNHKKRNQIKIAILL